MFQLMKRNAFWGQRSNGNRRMGKDGKRETAKIFMGELQCRSMYGNFQKNENFINNSSPSTNMRKIRLQRHHKSVRIFAKRWYLFFRRSDIRTEAQKRGEYYPSPTIITNSNANVRDLSLVLGVWRFFGDFSISRNLLKIFKFFIKMLPRLQNTSHTSLFSDFHSFMKIIVVRNSIDNTSLTFWYHWVSIIDIYKKPRCPTSYTSHVKICFGS